MTRRVRSTYHAALLLGLGLSVLGAGEARASFTIKADPGSPSGTPGPYTYSFSATLAAGDTLNTGDFFRIYDFQGFTGTETAPAGWSFSQALSNPVPPPAVVLQFGDDPTIPNLIWTYTGPSKVIDGPITIKGFSAQSELGGTSPKNFVGRVTLTGTSGTYNDSVGTIQVPTAGVLPPPAGVPEPSSMISAGLGLALLGFGYSKRSRARTTA
jgi:hypothetical protein